VYEDEIPSDHVVLSDGTILGPTEEGETPEFFVGPDNMIYPVGSGIDPDEEVDDADDDAGYYVEEPVDYDDDGTSEEDDYDDDEGWDTEE